SVHFVYDTTLFTMAVRHDTTVLFDLPILYYHTLISLFSSYLLTTYCLCSKRWMAICLYLLCLLYMDPLLFIFFFWFGIVVMNDVCLRIRGFFTYRTCDSHDRIRNLYCIACYWHHIASFKSVV